MRSFHLTGVLLASLALASTAVAGPYQVRGTPAFDRSSRTLYVDGAAYVVPEDVGTAKLRGADTVTVDWEQNGDRRVVTRYTAERDD